MAKRGYFEKENEHLKTHKIKILGRSRQEKNMVECEGRNRLIRRMRNYVPDVRFTGRERTDFSTVTPLTIANSFPEGTVGNFSNIHNYCRSTISSCEKDVLFIKAQFSADLTRFRLSPMCCSTW